MKLLKLFILFYMQLKNIYIYLKKVNPYNFKRRFWCSLKKTDECPHLRHKTKEKLAFFLEGILKHLRLVPYIAQEKSQKGGDQG